MLLAFRVWQLFWEKGSPSLFRIDFVLDDLDPNLAGYFSLDLEWLTGDFNTDVLDLSRFSRAGGTRA